MKLENSGNSQDSSKTKFWGVNSLIRTQFLLISQLCSLPCSLHSQASPSGKMAAASLGQYSPCFKFITNLLSQQAWLLMTKVEVISQYLNPPLCLSKLHGPDWLRQRSHAPYLEEDSHPGHINWMKEEDAPPRKLGTLCPEVRCSLDWVNKLLQLWQWMWCLESGKWERCQASYVQAFLKHAQISLVMFISQVWGAFLKHSN